MKSLRTTLVVSAAVGHLWMQTAVAAPPPQVMARQATAARIATAPQTDAVSSSAAPIRDVRLAGAERVLRGRMLDATGEPLVGQKVEIGRAGKLVSQAVTDSEGRFAMPGIQGGVCHLTANQRTIGLRVWTPLAAPPAAHDELVLVTGTPEQIRRGQQPLRALFGPEPILLGVLIAAAIAIPIAVHESDDAPSGS